MDATLRVAPPDSPARRRSPKRGMPERSSGFRSPLKQGAGAAAAGEKSDALDAASFKDEWEAELERRSQRRRESESGGREQVEEAPECPPTPPARLRSELSSPVQQLTAAQTSAAEAQAEEAGVADLQALEESEAPYKSPTPPPRRRSPKAAEPSESDDAGDEMRDYSPERNFAGTRWVSKAGRPPRRPLHPLRPPPPPIPEPPPDPPPEPIARNNSVVVNNFLRSAVVGATALAKELAQAPPRGRYGGDGGSPRGRYGRDGGSPRGRYGGDGGSERDNVFRAKARAEINARREAAEQLMASLPSLLKNTIDPTRLKDSINAAKAAGVAGPFVAMAEHKLHAFAVGEENKEHKAAAKALKEAVEAEKASPAGMARKAAEDQLRAAVPFPLQTADPAKLKPAIEAARQAGVAAPIVAMAEAKLHAAENPKPSRALVPMLRETVQPSSRQPL